MADKIRLPSSGGGLVNYGEEYNSKLKFSPFVVVAMIVLVVVFEYLLHRLF